MKPQYRNNIQYRDVQQLIDSSGDKSLRAILKEVSEAFKIGVGKYQTDGTFDPKALIFGEPIEPASRAHERARSLLTETIVYTQGSAHIVEGLYRENLVDRHVKSDYLYIEVHIKRSLSLLNEYFKGNTAGVTLSRFTGWGMDNNTRSRARIRDDIAPVFEYYSLWKIKRDAGGHAMITAGPVLVLFADLVVNNLPTYLDGA